MAQPRYITTLIRRLNTAETIELKFDYGNTKRAQAHRKQIGDALIFWRFYENLQEHLGDIKDLPGDIDVLRHEFLERVASEDTFRGFVACWLRLPVTVMETLKWSANLDIQSRESFLRRLEHCQLKVVREAYDEFFVHRVRPSCLSDGVFRRLVHAGVTYESLQAEPLLSGKRTESKCAWGRNVAHLDFGHAKYPQGPADDAADSGAFRKFFSVKNHAHDFAVNQHDGLYWFFYRTLRSNYLWNRNGHVELHPMICPGFWFTLIGWLFFTLISPALAFTVTFPVMTGNVGLSFLSFAGSMLGLVTPVLLVLLSIFYIGRDTPTIEWLGNALDNHVVQFGTAWFHFFRFLWFSFWTIMFGLITLLFYVGEEAPVVYPVIGLLWLLSYWYLCFKDNSVAPSLDGNGRSVLVILGVSAFIASAPYWSEILSGIMAIAELIFLIISLFGLQILLIGLIIGAAYTVGTYSNRLKEFQTARTGVTAERVTNERRFFIGLVSVMGAFYGGLLLWAGYSLLTTDSLNWVLLYPFLVLVIVLVFTWLVFDNAYAVQRADPKLVLRRNAYINRLREEGEEGVFLYRLMANDWVINHEDPVGAAKGVQAFVNRLTGFLDDASGLRMASIGVIDAGTAKRFKDYTREVVYEAYLVLDHYCYGEFVRLAYEGFSPEQALRGAHKLRAVLDGKKSFWEEFFLFRWIEAVFDFFAAIWNGIIKVFRDLFGMWQLLHKYCPAVANKKQI